MQLFSSALLLVIGTTNPTSGRPTPRWGDELPPPSNPLAVLLPSSRGRVRLEWPAPPLTKAPAAIKAIYLNAWVFGSQRFSELVRLADSTEVNAFVVDVKDDTGYLTYTSRVQTALEIGANQAIRAPDAAARLRVLQAHGIYPIARIVVAKDPLLASRKTAWSVRHVDGGLWRDRINCASVDGADEEVSETQC